MYPILNFMVIVGTMCHEVGINLRAKTMVRGIGQVVSAIASILAGFTVGLLLLYKGWATVFTLFAAVISLGSVTATKNFF